MNHKIHKKQENCWKLLNFYCFINFNKEMPRNRRKRKLQEIPRKRESLVKIIKTVKIIKPMKIKDNGQLKRYKKILRNYIFI